MLVHLLSISFVQKIGGLLAYCTRRWPYCFFSSGRPGTITQVPSFFLSTHEQTMWFSFGMSFFGTQAETCSSPVTKWFLQSW